MLQKQKHQVDNIIEATTKRILAHQQLDGSFSYCCEVTPLSEAVMVIFLKLIGDSADRLISDLCHTMAHRQRADGGWTLRPGEASDLSVTTLVYFALLLAGFPKTSPQMLKARMCIQKHGGITRASSFAKGFLAVAGQLPWSALPNPHIEMILWKEAAPINLFEISSPARIHLPSLMLLSHLNFSYHLPVDLTLMDLIDPDVEIPQRAIPLRDERAVEKCRAFLLERVEPNGTLASYLSATVMMVFALQAFGYSRNHPLIARAVMGLKDMAYRRKSFVHQQFFTSTVWDTSLAMRALTAAGVPPNSDALTRGAAYLLARQQHLLSDWHHHTANAEPGGWGFSNINTMYPDVDDTIAALMALYPFRRMVRSQWKNGAKWMLTMQNDDGGWAAFDRNCDNVFLKLLPTGDLKQVLSDPSTPDLTGRVLHTIGYTGIRATAAVSHGVNWLLGQQRNDGTWFGRWGIAFIYGTCMAVQGLHASGIRRDHSAMKKALSWFKNIQNADGGFGESCRSDEQDVYVPLKQSTASQTAWALMGMISASARCTPEMARAAQYLVATAHSNGGWREKYPTGAGIAGQAYIRYHSYPDIWPLMALCAFRQRWESG
ncbi:prenyltransferase/squalene oxidase repeat-containing protein [Alicyclobacillus fodiniaquatilis]|uniref:Prenyltransferase/squalene oxidase repeat-containing protein n=1 Tax=Alicyclobacillus fodiniaquatilis TaxID=1661150 RepID=A0ABW4JE37_9BACL